MAKEEAEKKMQQKYMEMQLLDHQMKQIQQQLQHVEQQVTEAEEVGKHLEELSKGKVGSKMLVPISSGIFISATLADNQQLAVNVGSNVIVKKSMPETKEMIGNQVIDMRKMQEELAKQFEKIAHRAGELEQELQQLIGA